MKKVFLDTNVVLDWVLERDETFAAKRIMQMSCEGTFEPVASFLTMANVAYIARKKWHTRELLYQMMSEIATAIRTLPMDEEQLRAAIAHPAPDFEDMLQYQCALSAGCDVIVTRNTRHFSFSELPLCTPQEFLDSQ